MTGPVFVKKVREHPFPYETFINLNTVEILTIPDPLLSKWGQDIEAETVTGKKYKVDFSDIRTPGDVE